MFYFSGRRSKIWVLAGILALETLLAGCGKKSVDYEENLKDSYGLANGTIAKRLSIPSGYSHEILLNNGKLTIKIEDTYIQTPDTDQMYVAEYSKIDYDKSYIEFITKALFEEESPIYIDDPEHPFVGDLNLKRDYWQGILDEAVAAGDTEWIESLQDDIEELERLYWKASDTRELAVDYEGVSYVGTLDGYESFLNFIKEYPNESGFFFDRFFWEGWYGYRPSYKGSRVAPHLISDNDNMEDNLCKLSMDAAISMGVDMFRRLNISDITCTDFLNVYWSYSDYGGNSSTIEYDGYYIEFQRAVNGIKVYMPYPSLFAITGNDGSYGADYTPTIESFNVIVDDSGILDITCLNQYQQISEKKVDDLISFSEAIEALGSGLQDFFTDHTSMLNELLLNDVRFTYYIIWNETEEKIQAVPAYTFAYVIPDENGEVLENNINSDYPDYLFVINALDGSFVDVVKNAWALSSQ